MMQLIGYDNAEWPDANTGQLGLHLSYEAIAKLKMYL
jgi:hypothetical protein